jgi:hypothetical protein
LTAQPEATSAKTIPTVMLRMEFFRKFPLVPRPVTWLNRRGV